MSPYEALKVVARGEMFAEQHEAVTVAIEATYSDDEARRAALQKYLDQQAQSRREQAERRASIEAHYRGERPRSTAAPVQNPIPASRPGPGSDEVPPEPSARTQELSAPAGQEEEAPHPKGFKATVLGALFSTSQLDPEDKLLVCCLLSFRGSRRGTYPSLNTLADRTGLSWSTVRRRLRSAERRPGGLRDRGVVVVRHGPAPAGAVGPGATHRYTVRHPKHWRLY